MPTRTLLVFLSCLLAGVVSFLMGYMRGNKHHMHGEVCFSTGNNSTLNSTDMPSRSIPMNNNLRSSSVEGSNNSMRICGEPHVSRLPSNRYCLQEHLVNVIGIHPLKVGFVMKYFQNLKHGNTPSRKELFVTYNTGWSKLKKQKSCRKVFVTTSGSRKNQPNKCGKESFYTQVLYINKWISYNCISYLCYTCMICSCSCFRKGRIRRIDIYFASNRNNRNENESIYERCYESKCIFR